MPWPRLAEHRSYLLDERINPELYLPADALDTLDKAEMQALAHDLTSHGLSCTIHATFMDLNPGSVDRAVRETTRQRVEQTLEWCRAAQGPGGGVSSRLQSAFLWFCC